MDVSAKAKRSELSKVAGGESGIRTHVRVSPKHAFQACAFSHSAISPASIGWEELLVVTLARYFRAHNTIQFYG